MTGSIDQDNSQWGALNGLRFFLALIVLTGHISSFVNLHGDWTNVGLWFNQGSAVFGFFLIDGFSCAERLAARATGFFVWRFYRIYPVFLANLLLVLAAYHFIGGDFVYPQGQDMPRPTPLEIVGTVFMLQQFATLFVPLNGQTWSVACYWWMSMFAPRFIRTGTPVILTLLIISYCLFLIFQHTMPAGMHVWTYGRSFLGSAWLWLTGFMWHRLRGTVTGVTMLIVPALAAALNGYFIGLPLLITLGVLAWSSRASLTPVWRKRTAWLGDVAYPIYLSHTPVVALFCYARITKSLVLTIASIVVAICLVQFVDYPARRWFRNHPFHLFGTT